MVFEKKLKLKWNLVPELGTYMMIYAKNGQKKSLFSKFVKKLLCLFFQVMHHIGI